MSPPTPFIVTADLPPAIQGWADGLRRAHYPPERNKISAHVTLFHAFAPSLRDELRGVLAGLAGEFAAPTATLSGIMPLGTGTALAIDSPGMLWVREMIAEHFHGALTSQDSHAPRLHITIQNKVTAQTAKVLQRQLAATLEPRSFTFHGLGLHLYRDTHWDTVGTWSFRGKQGS
jgi:hypothetical protein